MISPKDVIERIQESYAKGREAERAAVVKYLRELAAASNNAGYVALHTAAHDIEKRAHHGP